MHKPLFRTLFVSCLVITAACAGAPTSNADVEMVTFDAKISNQQLDHIDIACPFQLQNPTAATAHIDAADWTLTLGTQKLKGHATVSVAAPAGSNGNGTLKVQADLPVSAAAFAARAKKTSIPYHVAATFSIGTTHGAEQFDADWYGDAYPPKAPTVSVQAEGARYDNNLELDFQVSVNNSDPFPVTVDNLDYSLAVKGQKVSSGLLATSQRLDPASEVQFPVTRFIGRQDLHTLAKQLLELDKVPYTLTANVTVHGIALHTPITGEITFPK